MAKITCPKCDGKKKLERTKTCELCGGSGEGTGSGGLCQRCSGEKVENYYITCFICDGAGEIEDPRP
jgi:DnaJ-class molecular chaperone